MDHKIFYGKTVYAFLGILSLFLWMTGCGSTTTTTSSPISTNPVGTATSVVGTITNISIPNNSSTGGAPTVTFSVKDHNNNGVTGLTGMRFTIAKLIESGNGETAYWQSYINRTATKDAGDPGSTADGTSAIQANYENDGTLTDNGDGTYTYVFSNDLSAISTANGEALDVSYQPTLTHRVAIQISGTGKSTATGKSETVVANPTYDFRPSNGATTGLTTKNVAKTTSCNECHDPLAVHGGGRREVKYCVTCHNPGTTDPNSGLVLDFARMIHKIHRGENLPSVDSGGGTYTIWGYNDAEHDYSNVVFPQDIRHCDKCHDPADTENTPNANNYFLVPTLENCGSCHDDIVFDGSTPDSWETAHSGGTATNADCADCHGGSGATVDGRIAGKHYVIAEIAAASFEFNIISIEDTGPGEFPSVIISVTDPLNSDAPYDIKNDPEFTASGGVSTLNVKLAWDTDDIYNEGSGSGNVPASAVSMNAITSSVDNGDGTFTVTFTTAIPTPATGSGIVAIDGHPASQDEDGNYTVRTPVTGVSESFAITDSSATDRRAIVDIDKCNNCHYSVSLHGSNRTDNIQLCTMCHNPNNTDISKRPATTGSSPYTGYYATSTGTDGKIEESIDFKYMIHAIHAGDEDEHGFRATGITVYGYGDVAHDYSEVRFPGELKNCLTCHLEDTYILPLETTVLPTSITTYGAGGDPSTELADPDDDTNISPVSAVCSSCHDSTIAQIHMEDFGGLFSSTDAAISAANPETCVICHGDGDIADVKLMHGIAE